MGKDKRVLILRLRLIFAYTKRINYTIIIIIIHCNIQFEPEGGVSWVKLLSSERTKYILYCFAASIGSVNS